MKIRYLFILLLFVSGLFSFETNSISNIREPNFHPIKRNVVLPLIGLKNDIILLKDFENDNSFTYMDSDYLSIKEKNELNCKTESTLKTMVVLVFGQSNAANAGEKRYNLNNSNVLNFFNGKCYKANDPLLGTTGSGGSVWTRFAELYLKKNKKEYDRIIFHTIAVGGTPIKDWTPSGNLFKRIIVAKKQLDILGLSYTHIFYHQGEADALLKTNYIKYKSSLEYIHKGLKKLDIHAPFFVSIVGRFGKSINTDIRFAQYEFIHENKNVFIGSNSDIIYEEGDRYQIGHFTNDGLDKHAIQWINTIIKFEEENK